MSEYQFLAIFGALLVIAAQLGELRPTPSTNKFEAILGGFGLVCMVAGAAIGIISKV